MDQIQLVEELRGTKCRCGAAKTSRQTFCRTCYFTLPKKKRMALYRPVGGGYEEAYQQAVKELDGLKETEDARPRAGESSLCGGADQPPCGDGTAEARSEVPETGDGPGGAAA